jgi:hypothetical protein
VPQKKKKGRKYLSLENIECLGDMARKRLSFRYYISPLSVTIMKYPRHTNFRKKRGVFSS